MKETKLLALLVALLFGALPLLGCPADPDPDPDPDVGVDEDVDPDPDNDVDEDPIEDEGSLTFDFSNGIDGSFDAEGAPLTDNATITFNSFAVALRDDMGFQQDNGDNGDNGDNDNDPVETTTIYALDAENNQALIIVFPSLTEARSLTFDGFACTYQGDEADDVDCAIAIFVRDIAVGTFGSDGPNWLQDADEYYLFTSGSLTFNSVEGDTLIGSFNGEAVLVDPDDPQIGGDEDLLDINNGNFNVPVTDSF